MHAEWSAECSHDDPVLVVPWAGNGAEFVDLRKNPYDLDQIPEAEQHPALLHALRALNAPRSPVFTAKCDAWPLAPEDLTALQLDLDLHAAEWPAGFAGYIDLLWIERAIFVSPHRQEQIMHRLLRFAEPLELPATALECVLRPALVDLTGPQEGFAITLYVKALGHDAPSAYARWAEALAAVVALIRGKDLTFA